MDELATKAHRKPRLRRLSPPLLSRLRRMFRVEAAFGFLDLPSLRGIESACSTVGTKMGCLMIRTKLPCSLRAHNLLERIPSYRNEGYFSNSIWLSGFRSLARIYLVVGMSWRKLGLRRSFLRAMASIWRILSRVIPNTLPVSSSV
jgi:hypothetical protein